MGDNFSKDFFDQKYSEDNSIMDIKRKFSEAKKLIYEKKNPSYSPEKNVSFALQKDDSQNHSFMKNTKKYDPIKNNNKSEKYINSKYYEDQLRKELRESRNENIHPLPYSSSNDANNIRNESSELIILKQQIRTQNNSIQELRSMINNLLQDRNDQHYITGQLESRIKDMNAQIQNLEWELSESKRMIISQSRIPSLNTENNKYSRFPSRNEDFNGRSKKASYLDSPESITNRRYFSGNRTASMDSSTYNGYYPTPSDSTTQIIRMTDPNR
ncbi:hypothetical protein TPHA_0F03150 [Tetrapisispora phaffii CBS 4417]|uniref:Spindle pole component 29 n=1 Tax=Tetrapisispora phaffii (strain ATCC 24235 / CBS 4417 / NBRC 1672 / NRRL Y-8282 / UCD 70-5) TaxID=1071381 RepID=G8BUL0_TETPH|nr:hypothetical protein TPHA_0F03150 [Tetrapisispora phaffii CBS 4417]CCE63796.1 hypothetical protein TPHA_0F03150 [Tetrapisispora phaffii CBS 4417]